MITHWNAKKAILITLGVSAGIIVWFVMVVGTPITNLAQEITETGEDRSVVELSAGTPIPLIPGVSLTIKDAVWSNLVALPKRPPGSSFQRTIGPINREFRFLSVGFEIVNETDDRMSREDLSALVHVVGNDGLPIEGMDSFSISSSGERPYRVSIFDGYIEVPPDGTHVGSWIFELDSNRPNLKLVSQAIGFEFPIPVDGG